MAAIGAIVDAVASGELTPTEAEALSRLVENFAKAIEVSDLAKRIATDVRLIENAAKLFAVTLDSALILNEALANKAKTK